MFSRPQAEPLRFIATRLAVPELEKVARQPGIAEAFRLTVQYHDGRHPDQIATLTKMQSSDNAKMTVHYRRANDEPLVLEHAITAERFRAFNAALRKLGFDKLDDPDDIPWFGTDLWLVERSALTFHHDVIIPPESATGIHGEIVKLIHAQFREAIRAINP